MNAPAPRGPDQKYCVSCAAVLEASAAFCNRCGTPQQAAWAAPPAPARSGGATAAIVIGAIGVGAFVLLPIVGILAAIAIPNFLRYQLRSKAASVQADLHGLARAEAALRERTGAYLPIPDGVPAARAPGTAPRAWAAADLEVARQLDWIAQQPNLGWYAARAGADAEGNPSLSLCAVSDLDGDGRHAAWAVFLPARDAQGQITAEPPPAPCDDEAVVLEREPAWSEGDPVGVPLRVSPENVF